MKSVFRPKTVPIFPRGFLATSCGFRQELTRKISSQNTASMKFWVDVSNNGLLYSHPYPHPQKLFDRLVERLISEDFPEATIAPLNESVVTDYVGQVLATMIAYISSTTEHRVLKLRREKQIISKDEEFGGNMEFMVNQLINVNNIRYVIGVVIKSDSFGKGLTQLLLAMKSMWEVNKDQKMVYGFVTTAIQWQLVTFDGQTWKLSRLSIIIFQIYRADMTNLDQSFYIALDHITITEGNCEGLIFPLFENETELFPTRSLFDSSTMFSKSLDLTTSNMILTITTEKNTFQTATTNQRTSIEYQNQTITTEKSPYQYSLKTILGLSIGLGIPAAIGIILSSIYLIQFIKKRKKFEIDEL
ncbi:hypothetical protein I4U23_010768 [Adineta vaga]|nr:hypothetical protein I4U23_010768 [Adineta vaga]